MGKAKKETRGGLRNSPTAMWDGNLVGHPSSTSDGRHSSVVGDLSQKIEKATEKNLNVKKAGTKLSEGEGKARIVSDLLLSGFGRKRRKVRQPIPPASSSGEEERAQTITTQSIMPLLYIRLDADRMLEKAYSDVTAVEGEKRKCGNLKKEVSRRMKCSLASAVTAITLVRERRQAPGSKSTEDTINVLRLDLRQMDSKQRKLEWRNCTLEKKVEKFKKERQGSAK
ncbi:hypothetical protein M0802_010662 [Mischocyttarus mexicanus]|nr:hypothetical protein M0802_010662 [Mischocyttarus mexicanus]